MSKRKAHNPAKRYALLARQLFKNCGMAFVAGDDKKCHAFNLKTGKRETFNDVMAMALDAASFKWYVEMSVICRDQQNNEYIVHHSEVLGEYYNHKDTALADYLTKMHNEALKQCNSLHVITVAWVRVPVFRDYIDLEVLDTIYRELGAFNYLSKWEHEQQQKEVCTA